MYFVYGKHLCYTYSLYVVYAVSKIEITLHHKNNDLIKLYKVSHIDCTI